MADTHSKIYNFKANEYGNGMCFIQLEPMEGDLPCLSKGHLGLDLKPGQTIEDAEELARMLNEKIINVFFTKH